MEALLNDKWLLFFVEMFVKSTVIFAFVLLAVTLLKKKSAFIKHFILFAGFIAVLLLPLLSIVVPKTTFSLIKTHPVSVSKTAVSTVYYEEVIAPVLSTSKSVENVIVEKQNILVALISNIKDYVGVHYVRILYGVWLAGLLLFLAKLFSGYYKINSISKKGENVDSSPWKEFLSLFIRKTGFHLKVNVVKSEFVSIPMTWGLKSNNIILPLKADRWKDRQKAAAFLHELAHIKRKDFMVFIISKLACTLFWFNPLSFVVLKKLRFEQENACDEFVVSLGLKASSYALSLLEIGRLIGNASSFEATALCMAKKSELQKRLTTILEKKYYFKEIKMKTKLFMTTVLLVGLYFIASTNIYSNSADLSTQFNNINDNYITADEELAPVPDEKEVKVNVKVEVDDEANVDKDYVVKVKKIKDKKTGKITTVIVKTKSKDCDDMVFTDKDGKTHIINSKDKKVIFIGDDKKTNEMHMYLKQKKLEEMEKQLAQVHMQLEMKQKKIDEAMANVNKAMAKINSQKVKKELEKAMKEYELALNSIEKENVEKLENAKAELEAKQHEMIIIKELKKRENDCSKEEIEKMIVELKLKKLKDLEKLKGNLILLDEEDLADLKGKKIIIKTDNNKGNVWVSEDEDENIDLIEITEGKSDGTRLFFKSKDGKTFSTTEVLENKHTKGDLHLKFNSINGKLETEKEIVMKKNGEKTGLVVEVNFNAEFSKDQQSKVKKLIKKFKKQLPKNVKVDYDLENDKCELNVEAKKDILSTDAENILEEIKQLEKNISKVLE